MYIYTVYCIHIYDTQNTGEKPLEQYNLIKLHIFSPNEAVVLKQKGKPIDMKFTDSALNKNCSKQK